MFEKLLWKDLGKMYRDRLKVTKMKNEMKPKLKLSIKNFQKIAAVKIDTIPS